LFLDSTNSIYRLGKDEPGKDALIFFESVEDPYEKTFGMMTTKWRILCQPLQARLKHVGKIFLTFVLMSCVCIINSDDNL